MKFIQYNGKNYVQVFFCKVIFSSALPLIGF
jgi:hypothetical protein